MIEPIIVVKKDNIIIIIVDLKKTAYLKTAIIESECVARLKRDILEGPKYLSPLIESTSLRLSKFFFYRSRKTTPQTSFGRKNINILFS